MLMRLSPEKLVLHMSSNAQCDKLSPNSTYATDTYRFRHSQKFPPTKSQILPII